MSAAVSARRFIHGGSYEDFLADPAPTEDKFFEFFYRGGAGTCTSIAIKASMEHFHGAQAITLEEYATEAALAMAEVERRYGKALLEKFGGYVARTVEEGILLKNGVCMISTFMHGRYIPGYTAYPLGHSIDSLKQLHELKDSELQQPALIFSNTNDYTVHHLEFVSGLDEWLLHLDFIHGRHDRIIQAMILGVTTT